MHCPNKIVWVWVIDGNIAFTASLLGKPGQVINGTSFFQANQDWSKIGKSFSKQNTDAIPRAICGKWYYMYIYNKSLIGKTTMIMYMPAYVLHKFFLYVLHKFFL